MFWLTSYPIAVIARQKLNGLGEHWGVLFSNGSVAHYTAGGGFQVASHEIFARGKEVRKVRDVPLQRASVVQQRLDQISRNPRPYHATEWNCETFANWLTGEEAVSQQVGFWAIALLAAGFAVIAARA